MSGLFDTLPLILVLFRCTDFFQKSNRIPICEATVVWDEQFLTIPIDEADSDPLVGMSLMEGYELKIQVIDDGIVKLMKLPTL